MTGVTLLSVEVGPKLLELLHDVVPKATIIALLVNPTNPNVETQSRSLQAAALKLGLQLHILNASTERDFDAVFAKLHELRTDALMIAQDGLFNIKSEQLAALSIRHSMPAIYVNREFVAAGGLMSYGTSQSDAWRQAGVYTGQVLKGAKPADLPVLQPTKFDFVINLKTAKALGLDCAAIAARRRRRGDRIEMLFAAVRWSLMAQSGQTNRGRDGRYWGNSGQKSAQGRNGSVAFDPNVWSGRALQVDFAELAVSGLASMYPASDWSVLCSGPSWISARVRSH